MAASFFTIAWFFFMDVDGYFCFKHSSNLSNVFNNNGFLIRTTIQIIKTVINSTNTGFLDKSANKTALKFPDRKILYCIYYN